MSDRLRRVNELVHRVVSDLLHTRFREESLYISLIRVVTSPDLRHARVYYSVLGEDTQGAKKAKAEGFFKRKRGALRSALSKEVRLKYLPDLKFIYDDAMAHAAQLNEYMDSMGLEGEGDWSDEEDGHNPFNA